MATRVGKILNETLRCLAGVRDRFHYFFVCEIEKNMNFGYAYRMLGIPSHQVVGNSSMLF